MLADVESGCYVCLMCMIRSRFISLLLTLVVGVGMASSAFAHRLPTLNELQFQALQAIGLVQGSICGDLSSGKGKEPCPDKMCGLCPASTAALCPVASFVQFVALRATGRVVWRKAVAVPMSALVFGPPSQAPPASL